VCALLGRAIWQAASSRQMQPMQPTSMQDDYVAVLTDFKADLAALSGASAKLFVESEKSLCKPTSTFCKANGLQIGGCVRGWVKQYCSPIRTEPLRILQSLRALSALARLQVASGCS